jgi:transcriptional regulator with PAS, ATPase and Fis domain
VVAATNKDLAELVRQGKFREDLFYRIRVIHLRLPPLRERREDIPLLVDRFIAKFNRLQDKDITGVSPEVIARLMEHDYPGNVRELENIIEQAFVLCRGGTIGLNHLPPELKPAVPETGAPGSTMSIRWMERCLIEAALRRQRNSGSTPARSTGNSSPWKSSLRSPTAGGEDVSAPASGLALRLLCSIRDLIL